MKGTRRSVIGILVMVMVFAGATWAGMVPGETLVRNGGFDRDLARWLTLGDVSVERLGPNKIAVLGDEQSEGVGLLGQFLTIRPRVEKVRVSFDYLFAGRDRARLYDDIFFSTFGFLHGDDLDGNNLVGAMQNGVSSIPHLALRIAIKTSGNDLSREVVHYDASYDVSGILPHRPNALIGFGLLEHPGYLRDRTDTFVGIDNVRVAAEGPVPEPASLFLFGSSLLGLAGVRRRKNKS